MSRSLLFDPRSEQASNSPLEISPEGWRGPGVYLTSQAWPDPPQEILEAQTRDGRRRLGPPILGNRAIPLGLYVVGDRTPRADLTNLVTNPSFEVDLAGWSTGGSVAVAAGATATRVTDESAFGEAAARIVTGAVNLHGVGFGGLAVVAGTTYKGLAWLKGAPGETVQFLFAGTGLGPAIGQTITFNGEWQLVRIEVTPSGSGPGVLAVRQQSAAARTFYVDGVAFGPGIDDFFDGDQPGSAWSSTAHASTSTRPGDPETYFERMVYDVEEKLAKLRKDGGTISRPFKAGRIVFDVEGLAGENPGGWEGKRFRQLQHAIQTTLDARPHGRLSVVTSALQTQTADPVLVWLQDPPSGSVDALGELEISELAAVDRGGLIAAIEVPTDYDPAAATAGLYYQAEALTPLAGATLAARSGAVGAGSNVVKQKIRSDWTPIVSTKIAASGLHLTHVGVFAIMARVRETSGVPAPLDPGGLELRLEWGQGDLRSIRANARWASPVVDGMAIAELGLVRISKAKVGLQRWEGRIVGRATKNLSTEVEIDDIRIIPVSDAYLDLRQSLSLSASIAPSALSSADDFIGSSAVIAGRTLQTGVGTWVGSGDTDDGDVTTAEVARRVLPAVSDADIGQGRHLIAGTAVLTDTAVEASLMPTSPAGSLNYGVAGLIARYVDPSNFLLARMIADRGDVGGASIQVVRRQAGGNNVIWTGRHVFPAARMRLFVVGNEWLLAAQVAGAWVKLSGGTDANLAAGGVLDDGRVGFDFYHQRSDAVPTTVMVDEFRAWIPSRQRAIFAGRRGRWRHDGYWREDASGGDLWTPLSGEGDNLFVPPKTKEGRRLRVFVAPSRSDLVASSDDGGQSDDFSARLSSIPRVVNVRRS